MESKRKLFGRLFVTGALLPALLFFVCIGVVNVHAQTTAPTSAAAGAAAAAAAAGHGELSLAIALAVGLACLGAGYAVGKVGAAAIGAAAEKPELFTRALIYLALAEGIAIYGLLVAMLLYIKY